MIRLSELLTTRGFVPNAKRAKLVRHKDSRLDLEELRSAGWFGTSILETFSRNLGKEEALSIEAFFKQKLGTRAFGLNAN